MKCPKCHKPIKEDTEGNKKYCQGHSFFEKEDGDAHPRNPDFCAKRGGECYFDDHGKRVVRNQEG